MARSRLLRSYLADMVDYPGVLLYLKEIDSPPVEYSTLAVKQTDTHPPANCHRDQALCSQVS